MMTPGSGQRVVVTGMGVVSAVGNELAEFWSNLCAGQSGIRECNPDDASWSTAEGRMAESFLAAPVTLASPFPHCASPALSRALPPASSPGGNHSHLHQHLHQHADQHGSGQEPVSPEYMDNFSRFAVHATEQALRQAGKPGLLQHKQRIGVILGTAVGGDDARNQATYRVYVKHRQPAPQTILRAMANGAVSSVSMTYGFQGPSYAVSSACASGTQAIGQAFQLIRSGCADIMIAGGSEQLPSYSLYRSWRQMRVLSPTGCRPFCASRNGMVLGEGAGILVLESLQSAQQRGANILGEITGFCMNAAASDWTRPDSASMAACIAGALHQAAWQPGQIGLINAHGTGTLLNDSAESTAIQQVFGHHSRHLLVSSGKAMHGHALGATGAIECIATLLSLSEGRMPPNNVAGSPQMPDPQCDMKLVLGQAREHDQSHALSHSFAFGGLNSVIALRRFIT